MSPPSPRYEDFHEALKEGVSPQRATRNPVRTADDANVKAEEEEQQASLRRIDRDLQRQPDVFKDAERALSALLVVRNSVANELRKQKSQVREEIISRHTQPTAAAPTSPIQGILSRLSGPELNVSSANESEDALPAIPNTRPVRDKLIEYNSLTNSECAGINASNIISQRPWLANNQKTEAQASAAAHLLLYAEGLQTIREHLTANEGAVKVGSEVTISPEVFSGDASGNIKTGIVIALKGKGVATVHISGAADSSNKLEIDIQTKYLRPKTRRIVPMEAIDRWGPQGVAVPSIAAHTKFQSPNSDSSKAFPSASECRHILNVIDGPVSMPKHVSSASGFTLGDTSFHIREVAGGEDMKGDNARYRQLVSMISKSVLVVDNPNVIREACDHCYDRNVEPGILIKYCGRVGRVVQVNSAAETARLAFTKAHIWVPISAITLCNPDPMASIGCRNATVSVIGNPTKEDVALASKAIAKRESEKWKIRKMERGD